MKAEVKCVELIIEPGEAQGTISEINILIHMPQTHCFPQQRDLRPSTFYARAKDLGQNQSLEVICQGSQIRVHKSSPRSMDRGHRSPYTDIYVYHMCMSLKYICVILY